MAHLGRDGYHWCRWAQRWAARCFEAGGHWIRWPRLGWLCWARLLPRCPGVCWCLQDTDSLYELQGACFTHSKNRKVYFCSCIFLSKMSCNRHVMDPCESKFLSCDLPWMYNVVKVQIYTNSAWTIGTVTKKIFQGSTLIVVCGWQTGRSTHPPLHYKIIIAALWYSEYFLIIMSSFLSPGLYTVSMIFKVLTCYNICYNVWGLRPFF